MKHIFYLIAVIPILWEMTSLYNIKKVHTFIEKLKLIREKPYDDYSTNQKTLGILMLGYFIWVIIGLFSSQWVLFLILLSMSMIPKKYIIIRWVDSFISLILLVFILLNAYHFKIDVSDYILGLF